MPDSSVPPTPGWPLVEWSVDRIVDALANGECPSDAVFDHHLPREMQRLSGTYFTPVAVAHRVACWLREHGTRTALDVGSGAGKLCVVAALSANVRWIGLEHRPPLVESARRLASRFALGSQVDFHVGALGEARIPAVDAYYLYNPFGENLYGYLDRIDGQVELGRERYAKDIAHMEALLEEAAVGTLLVTYNGFGGRVPATFTERRVDRTGACVLRLHEKTCDVAAGPGKTLPPHDDLD